MASSAFSGNLLHWARSKHVADLAIPEMETTAATATRKVDLTFMFTELGLARCDRFGKTQNDSCNASSRIKSTECAEGSSDTIRETSILIIHGRICEVPVPRV